MKQQYFPPFSLFIPTFTGPHSFLVDTVKLATNPCALVVHNSARLAAWNTAVIRIVLKQTLGGGYQVIDVSFRTVDIS